MHNRPTAQAREGGLDPHHAHLCADHNYEHDEGEIFTRSQRRCRNEGFPIGILGRSSCRGTVAGRLCSACRGTSHIVPSHWIRRTGAATDSRRSATRRAKKLSWPQENGRGSGARRSASTSARSAGGGTWVGEGDVATMVKVDLDRGVATPMHRCGVDASRHLVSSALRRAERAGDLVLRQPTTTRRRCCSLVAWCQTLEMEARSSTWISSLPRCALTAETCACSCGHS